MAKKNWLVRLGSHLYFGKSELTRFPVPIGIPYARYPMFHEWRDQRTMNQSEWGALKKKLELIPGFLEKLGNLFYLPLAKNCSAIL